jgi:sec-independent protein translocase protein TatB
MANLGMADSLILMVMALVVFGPRRLPQIGRQIGKLMYEFRKASNDFKFQMEEELRSAEEADRRKADEERMKALAVTTAAPQLGSPEPETTTTLEATVPPAALENPNPENPHPESTYSASPYPEETDSPSATAEPAEPAAEESYPRIQPPSTGEQVAAARPNSVIVQAKAAQEERAEVSAEPVATVAEEAPTEPSTADAQPPSEAEQAVPHG